MKKLRVPAEIMYILGIIILALSVAMMTAADMGMSMIVAPAYLLSLEIGVTFGQAEYIIQAVLLIVMCIILKKFKPIFLSAFITC